MNLKLKPPTHRIDATAVWIAPTDPATTNSNRAATTAVPVHAVRERMIGVGASAAGRRLKIGAPVWATPPSGPNARRWSMPRLPCASWPLRPMARL